MSAALNAWMNGERVGTWQIDRGVHRFAYAPSWLESPKVRPLSLSLPLTRTLEIRGPVVEHFFDNLLPDNQRIRERIGRRFKTCSLDAFALLEAIGRDCVGAVQLLPLNETPEGWDQVQSTPLTDDQVAAILRAVPDDPLTRHTDDAAQFRLSLAGAQEKTALLRVGTQWCKPIGATPSTHILKLPLGTIANTARIDMFDSIDNEWLCAQIIAALGLPVARTAIATFDEQRALVVERFDREWMDGGRWVARLPQEDFCQALGYASHQKYEADGGPSISKALELLAGSADAGNDRLAFQLTQLAFWLMAATDGHAKNYSIFLRQGNDFGMTPLYDVLSVWPYVGKGRAQLPVSQVRLAMALRSKNAHYLVGSIQARHWHDLAMKHGGTAVWQQMQAFVDRVEPALKAVESRLPAGFPERIWTPVASGMRRQVEKFRGGVTALR